MESGRPSCYRRSAGVGGGARGGEERRKGRRGGGPAAARGSGWPGLSAPSARAAPAPPAELRCPRRAATPPPPAPSTRGQTKQVAGRCRRRGPGGSLTLILLSGLGSSGRGVREDQRTTSPRKLPTTSKLRKMNPIFSLIFLRRRETHSPAQPPPPLSPPSFPLLRLSSSSSSFPHPYRYRCRPLRCLPFPAPDPELPSAIPFPGLFPSPFPAAPSPPAATAELRLTRVPRSSRLPSSLPAPLQIRSPLLSTRAPFTVPCYLATNLHFPQVWSLAFALQLSSLKLSDPQTFIVIMDHNSVLNACAPRDPLAHRPLRWTWLRPTSLSALTRGFQEANQEVGLPPLLQQLHVADL